VKIIDVSHDIVDDDGLNLRDQTLREVHILRLVQGHKYIINLEDVFESPTYIFLVFELCPNGELFDYLTTQVPPVECPVFFIISFSLNYQRLYRKYVGRYRTDLIFKTLKKIIHFVTLTL
jgi:serine/threonine protein kinase